VIEPKVTPTTAADEKRAYQVATIRDDDTSQRCLRNCGPTARDHRQNREPGNTVPSNLQVLGLRCHQWKTEHPKAAVAAGWSVPRHTALEPREWPARRWLPAPFGMVRLAWVLLDDSGGWIEIDEVEATFRRRKGGMAA
jgi:hypothetical protein